MDKNKVRRAMTKHMTGTREEWLAARLDLLKAEKELTRRSDELARRRQELPWVPIDKKYRFETDEGSASLADLFRGRSQLLVYHFMFGADYTAGCPSCSAIADGFGSFVVHLANHDVTLSEDQGSRDVLGSSVVTSSTSHRFDKLVGLAQRTSSSGFSDVVRFVIGCLTQ